MHKKLKSKQKPTKRCVYEERESERECVYEGR
jgi:hypothetical protein